MIGAEVVDLFSEDGHPEILADELHEVELILELRTLLGQLLDEAVTGVEPDELEVGERLLSLLGVSLLEYLSDQLQVQQLEWDLLSHGQVLDGVKNSQFMLLLVIETHIAYLINCRRLLVSHSDQGRLLEVLLLGEVFFDLKGCNFSCT